LCIRYLQEDAINIIKLITGMAKSLNMKAVAEGVETQEQLESLQALGCDFAQGYLFGKPQPYVAGNTQRLSGTVKLRTFILSMF
jgi:EAL domain-containing protein (putative c-di-GMP-specific phosphodiesterase class I)